MSDNKSDKPQAEPRSSYRVFRSIGTRWMDNDAYGHVNNVVYYSWFDTAVNAYLIEQGALDIERSEVIGLVIEAQCYYFAPLAFPQMVDAGIRVAKDEVHVHDFHATILHLLGFNHEQLTYRHNGRDYRLTDVAGKVVKGILA